eukprot:gnl/TRDRNA2_/TRDRNA2_167947_c0_seq1.p1 gnl/TRDRNA2_/TRDRNA2_167947_c0~~gnl/TRDRNA2_/TRDRNA2_167947_c0_seq1.p1  ORF type:complete len:524 (-),score=65.34 gnl/TRDRNA2_/TRDRNA2_167947_c0_seq1:30-1601(-)
MRISVVSPLLACIVQPSAKELVAGQTTHMQDEMVQRVFETSRFHALDLDGTMLGKGPHSLACSSCSGCSGDTERRLSTQLQRGAGPRCCQLCRGPSPQSHVASASRTAPLQSARWFKEIGGKLLKLHAPCAASSAASSEITSDVSTQTAHPPGDVSVDLVTADGIAQSRIEDGAVNSEEYRWYPRHAAFVAGRGAAFLEEDVSPRRPPVILEESRVGPDCMETLHIPNPRVLGPDVDIPPGGSLRWESASDAFASPLDQLHSRGYLVLSSMAAKELFGPEVFDIYQTFNFGPRVSTLYNPSIGEKVFGQAPAALARLSDPELKEESSSPGKKAVWLQSTARPDGRQIRRVHMDASTLNGVQFLDKFGVKDFASWSPADILRSNMMNMWTPLNSTKRLFMIACSEAQTAQLMERNGWGPISENAEGENPWIVFVEDPREGWKHFRALPALTTHGKPLAEECGVVSCEGCVVLFQSDTLMHSGANQGSSAEYRFLVDFGDLDPPSADEAKAAADFYAQNVEVAKA